MRACILSWIVLECDIYLEWEASEIYIKNPSGSEQPPCLILALLCLGHDVLYFSNLQDSDFGERKTSMNLWQTENRFSFLLEEWVQE